MVQAQNTGGLTAPGSRETHEGDSDETSKHQRKAARQEVRTNSEQAEANQLRSSHARWLQTLNAVRQAA